MVMRCHVVLYIDPHEIAVPRDALQNKDSHAIRIPSYTMAIRRRDIRHSQGFDQENADVEPRRAHDGTPGTASPVVV